VARLVASEIAAEIAHREGVRGAIVVTLTSDGGLEVGLAADTGAAHAGKLLDVVKAIRAHLAMVPGHHKHTENATLDGLPVDLFNERKN
jgi:hypothetical protein